jgi:hypothetical protein
MSFQASVKQCSTKETVYVINFTGGERERVREEWLQGLEGKHSATLTAGTPGVLHGTRTYLLQVSLFPLQIPFIFLQSPRSSFLHCFRSAPLCVASSMK